METDLFMDHFVLCVCTIRRCVVSAETRVNTDVHGGEKNQDALYSILKLRKQSKAGRIPKTSFDRPDDSSLGDG